MAIAGALGVAGTLWLMLHYKPTWYSPAPLDDATVHSAQVSTAELLDFIGDRLARGESFEVTMADADVNKWLAALPRLWLDYEETVPPELNSVAVRFESGCCYVGIHYLSKTWQSIIHCVFSVGVARDDSGLLITMADLRVGSVPVPQAALLRIAGRYDAPYPNAGVVRRDGQAANGKEGLTRYIDELFAGKTVRNRFIWPNGERPFRIDSIKFDLGELRVGLAPL